MAREQGAETVIHPLDPVFDNRSTILILGTMPSPKSRELGFYYMHPQNRFWKVLAAVLEPESIMPVTVEDRTRFLLDHGIALWDVLHSCRIRGAGDSSIRDPVANDLGRVLSHAPIRSVFTTGKKALSLYNRYCLEESGIEAVALPSPSAANCAVSNDSLRAAYSVILGEL